MTKRHFHEGVVPDDDPESATTAVASIHLFQVTRDERTKEIWFADRDQEVRLQSSVTIWF